MTARFLLLTLSVCILSAVGLATASGQTDPSAPSTRKAPGASTASWHAVEVVVFRNMDATDALRQSWPATVEPPSLAHALYPGAIDAGAYSALDGHGTLVANALLRLQGSGHYDVIKTLGWRQPGTTSRRVSFAPLPATASAATGSINTYPEDQDAVRLRGTARMLSAGRRTYMSLHLRLCEPTPPGLIVETPFAGTNLAAVAASVDPAMAATSQTPESSPPGEQCFALDQRHEVGPGKLAYFDNPVFGALVSVRSIKPPANSTTTP